MILKWTSFLDDDDICINCWFVSSFFLSFIFHNSQLMNRSIYLVYSYYSRTHIYELSEGVEWMVRVMGGKHPSNAFLTHSLTQHSFLIWFLFLFIQPFFFLNVKNWVWTQINNNRKWLIKSDKKFRANFSLYKLRQQRKQWPATVVIFSPLRTSVFYA